MGLGTPLFGGLLRSNAVVSIQAGTPAPAGGTQYTWATLKAGVDVLVSQTGGGRDFASAQFNARGTLTVAGKEPLLNRPDVRLLVTAAGKGLANLVGRHLSVAGGGGHSAGVGGLLKARINLSCVVQEVPGDDGGEL